jgi:hypothetical protein
MRSSTYVHAQFHGYCLDVIYDFECYGLLQDGGLETKH